MKNWHVIIVGGGASGIIMAAHLLREADDCLVTIVERSAEIGRGIAYAKSATDYLLNVPTGNMGAYVDDPGHFARWLQSDSLTATHQGDPPRFVARAVYGRYLESLAADLTKETGRLRIVRGECRALAEEEPGVVITLADGQCLSGDCAVLATGNDSYGWPGQGAYASPWREPDTQVTSPRNDPILVLGTGLSMIDYVLALTSGGYRGPILALSRHGLLPQVHGVAPALATDSAEVPFGQPPGTLLHWLRRRVNDYAAEGGDWRGVMDGLRPHVGELWLRLSRAARRSFLTHGRAWWDVYRHRMAPEIAERLAAIRESGQLRVVAARLISSEKIAGGYGIRYRPRGSASIDTAVVQDIVDCRGIVTDPANSANPLILHLLEHGLAKIDPLGIGLDIAPDYAVVRADGAPSRRIHAIGPVARAAFWECTSVPDIRAQCSVLARRIRAMPQGIMS